MSPVQDPDFPVWLAFVFDPSASDGPFGDWYWSLDPEPFETSPRVAVAHILRLLEAPGALLEMHHDNQVASGLKYVFDPGCGGEALAVGDSGVAHADRLEVAARIDRLYGEVFVPRAPPVLGHRSEEGGRLAALAYMFFDCAAFGIPAEGQQSAEFNEALLDAMARILALPHAGAQEGALHGLGHAWSRHPGRVEEIIDRWLARDRAARHELLDYARAARCGCVL